MNNYKAVIVDDEPSARENLKDMLAAYCPNVITVGEAEKAQDAVRLITSTDFNILFLDINLGKETGFDVLQQLPGLRLFHIIFVTAYDEYALKAFRHAAIDYLLKPVSRLDLISSIARIDNLRPRSNTQNKALETLMQLQAGDSRKIVVPGKDGSDIIAVSKIIVLEADGSYTRIHLTDGKILYSAKSMKHYENLLSLAPQFIRIHKSYVVNKNCIARIVKSKGGHVVLENGAVVPVSDQMKDLVYNLFSE